MDFSELFMSDTYQQLINISFVYILGIPFKGVKGLVLINSEHHEDSPSSVIIR